MRTKKAFTLEEVTRIMEEMSDEEVESVVIIPPTNRGDVTDEEEEAGPSSAMPQDVAGQLEVDIVSKEVNEKEEDQPTLRTLKKKRCKKEDIKWQMSKEIVDDPIEVRHFPSPVDLLPHLIDLSPYQLFRHFFSDDIVAHIVTETNRYACQKNHHDKQVSSDEIMRFIGILFLSGYNRLPHTKHYWSVDEDVGVPIVSNAMPRNRFTTIKSHVHLVDNESLNQEDKGAKVNPFFGLVNEKLIQFGIFSKHLSIDEQMCPYYGKHSAKMFMKNKPVKFGYKFWVLASEDGYPYRLNLYLGKDSDREEDSLGAHVVKQLISIIDHPACHTVTFDNFFSSYNLLRDLSEKNMVATGTVRYNRLRNAPLPAPQEAKKLPRGSIRVASDGKVIACCWTDNKPVYAISNLHGVSPVTQKSRYSKAQKTHVELGCPSIITEYNQHMGGVDLCDRFLSEYRPTIKGKKWWFSLFIHGLNTLVVASWRLHVSLGGKCTQLEFLRDVTRCLLKVGAVGQRIPRERQNPRQQLADVRYDRAEHFCEKGTKEGRCKVRECQRNTYYVCSKCNVRLHQKCFERYHAELSFD